MSTPGSAKAHLIGPIRFAIVGLINTVSGLAVIYLLLWVFQLHDVSANLIGYATGITISFFLNAHWTFAFRGDLARAASRFVAVVGLGYIANLATVMIALHGLSLNSYIAQASGVIPYALVTYLGSKYFAFANAA